MTEDIDFSGVLKSTELGPYQTRSETELKRTLGESKKTEIYNRNKSPTGVFY